MCGKSIDYDQSEMRKHFRTRHEGWSLENYYDNFIRKKQVIQRSLLFCAPGLVKFVTAVAKLFCLALLGSFLTMKFAE